MADPTPPEHDPDEAAPPDDEPTPPDASGDDGVAPSPSWSAGTKRLIGSAFVVACLLILYLSRNVLALAALAGLIAFLISPLIRVLHVKLRMPRVLALLVSYLVVFIGLIVVGVLIADGVVGAAREVDVPEAERSLKSSAEDTLRNVREIKVGDFTLDLSEAVDPLLDKLDNPPRKGAEDGSGDSRRLSLSSQQLESLFGNLSSTARTISSAVVAAFMSAIITALVAMYLNADSEKFRRGLLSAVPPAYEGDAQRLATKTMSIWRGYLYGQVFNSITVGLMMWIILWLIGLPGAFMFALILGLLNMVPTFGPVIAAVPPVLAALALGSTRLDWSRLAFTLLVVALYLVVVQLHANLMAPFITGKAVKLAPATIMIGLLVGIHVGGIVGALLVVPVIATGKEYGRYVLAKLTDRDPFPAAST
jgi:predicted PurR-regulated permease PerM